MRFLKFKIFPNDKVEEEVENEEETTDKEEKKRKIGYFRDNNAYKRSI